jgi:carotenoid cleavage dioxygenase
MVHDFAVSEHFIAIPLFPLVLDLAAGGFAFHPEHGSFLGVIDRQAGPASLRWHAIRSGFAFHVAQAWDHDGVLQVELMRSDVPPLFPGPPGNSDAFLTRYRLAPRAATVQIEEVTLADRVGELPRIDERRAGRGARHVFCTSGDAVWARDDATGTTERFGVGPGDIISEPVFVPRSPAEGDGWLLAVIYRAATRRSDLAVLDAAALAAGPVALAHLPVRVPDGFHGAWLAAPG